MPCPHDHRTPTRRYRREPPRGRWLGRLYLCQDCGAEVLQPGEAPGSAWPEGAQQLTLQRVKLLLQGRRPA